MIVQNKTLYDSLVLLEFNLVLKLLLKALALLSMSLFVQKLSALKHGLAKHMLNAKKVFVLNQIINIAVMIVLITIKTQWNALVLSTLRNVNMLSIT